MDGDQEVYASDFFSEMLMKPSTKAKFVVDEITRAKIQLVQDRNLSKLGIIELRQDIDHLEGEVIEARQHLEQLKAKLATKWTSIAKARAREEILFP